MAKKNAKPAENSEVVAESTVVEVSKLGVAVYKPGMHPRQLRVAAEEAAKAQVGVSGSTEDEEAPEVEEEAPDEE